MTIWLGVFAAWIFGVALGLADLRTRDIQNHTAMFDEPKAGQETPAQAPSTV